MQGTNYIRKDEVLAAVTLLVGWEKSVAKWEVRLAGCDTDPSLKPFRETISESLEKARADRDKAKAKVDGLVDALYCLEEEIAA